MVKYLQQKQQKQQRQQHQNLFCQFIQLNIPLPMDVRGLNIHRFMDVKLNELPKQIMMLLPLLLLLYGLYDVSNAYRIINFGAILGYFWATSLNQSFDTLCNFALDFAAVRFPLPLKQRNKRNTAVLWAAYYPPVQNLTQKIEVDIDVQTTKKPSKMFSAGPFGQLKKP